MTRRGWGVALWIVMGAIVWLGVFEYIETRGHKEYLYRAAEARAGIAPPDGKSADLREVLAVERRHAMIHATGWALFVGGMGIATVLVLTARRARTL